jgi:hypothetical protein
VGGGGGGATRSGDALGFCESLTFKGRSPVCAAIFDKSIESTVGVFCVVSREIVERTSSPSSSFLFPFFFPFVFSSSSLLIDAEESVWYGSSVCGFDPVFLGSNQRNND